MKVIHLISGGDSGGAKTHVLSLLQGLNSAVRADLVCFRDGPFVRQARNLQLPVEVFPEKNLLTLLIRLTRFIRRNGYDLIHCHGTRANVIGALLKSVVHIPVVTTVHSDPRLDYLGRPLARLTLGTLNHLALRRLDFHIGVSEATVDLLVRRGIVKKDFFSIYNGVPFAVAPAVTKEDCLLRFGLSPNEGMVVAGIAARLDPVKDLQTLLRGFAAAHSRCPKLRLLIAGDGPERQALVTLARTLGIEDRIVFCGWVEDMERFYGALDINVLTSRSETFPYSLTEGARFGLATVASAVGGIPDLIQHGTNGFLFSAGDWKALSAYLAGLAADDDLRHTLGSRLRERAETHFSLEQTIQSQLRIYQQILLPPSRKKVLICGSYGQGNAGDEAVLTVILDELRSIDPQLSLCVMSRFPRVTRARHRVETVYTFWPFSWYSRMDADTLFLQGGGSLLQNTTSRRSLWFYLSTLWAARKRGCQVMLYGCGIGPIRGAADRALTARILNRCADAITLRDPRSLDELQGLGVNRPRMVVAADPALHPAKPLRSHTETSLVLEPGRRYLGIILRLWPGFRKKASEIATAVELFCREQDLSPLFIPMGSPSDLRAARQTASLLKGVSCTILPSCPPLAVFGKLELVLSMRLHGLIFSAAAGTPAAGIAYDPKVRSFLELIGPHRCLSLEETEVGSLLALLRRSLVLSEEEKANIQKLLKQESKNADLARHLLYDRFDRGELP